MKLFVIKYLRNIMLILFFISLLCMISNSYAYACTLIDIPFASFCDSIPSFIYCCSYDNYMEKGSTKTTYGLSGEPVTTYTAPEDGYYSFFISRWDWHQISYSCSYPGDCIDYWFHCDVSGSPPPSEIPATFPYECKYMGEISGSAEVSIPIICVNESLSMSQFVYWCSEPERCSGISVRVSHSEVWPQKTGGDTETGVVVSLSKPAPPEGCYINLKVQPVENSGGHKHDSSKPKGTVNPQTISFSAGETGAKSAIYASSEVAGEEKIKAEVDGETKSEAMIKVKVPGFFELGEGDEYVLIGQTTTHPGNHYGTENTLFSLLDLVSFYNEVEKGTLQINDISLIWGGLFDIYANWSPPHKSHRMGKNVDIDDVTAEGKVVSEESLKKIIRETEFNIAILPEGNHFHLTFL